MPCSQPHEVGRIYVRQTGVCSFRKSESLHYISMGPICVLAFLIGRRCVYHRRQLRHLKDEQYVEIDGNINVESIRVALIQGRVFSQALLEYKLSTAGGLALKGSSERTTREKKR